MASTWSVVNNFQRATTLGKGQRLRMSENKVKVKLSLCLTKHHAMKTLGSGGEWSALRPGRFTPSV
jgi:hypothetical protein